MGALSLSGLVVNHENCLVKFTNRAFVCVQQFISTVLAILLCTWNSCFLAQFTEILCLFYAKSTRFLVTYKVSETLLTSSWVFFWTVTAFSFKCNLFPALLAVKVCTFFACFCLLYIIPAILAFRAISFVIVSLHLAFWTFKLARFLTSKAFNFFR
jgi:hypothetical protein